MEELLFKIITDMGGGCSDCNDLRSLQEKDLNRLKEADDPLIASLLDIADRILGTLQTHVQENKSASFKGILELTNTLKSLCS